MRRAWRLLSSYLILSWLDEPTRVTTQDALAKMVDESTMPIGLGRHVTGMAEVQSLLAG